MSRYIDFYLIGELVDSHGNVHYEDLKNLPTADVVERNHGEWIEINDGLVKGYCSQCGWLSYYYENEIIGMNYCPNCGADMREGKEE